jgi:hypothetical protein
MQTLWQLPLAPVGQLVVLQPLQFAGTLQVPVALHDIKVHSRVPLQLFCVAQVVPAGINGWVQFPLPSQMSFVHTIPSLVHAVPPDVFPQTRLLPLQV